MNQLTKGANMPVPTSAVTVTVDVAANADLSALLVRPDYKVRSDADFVFYNQPEGPGVTCVPPAGGQPWQVRVDLAAVPGDVHAVRIVSSLDDGGKVFGQVGQPTAHIVDASGTPLADFTMVDLNRELIVVAVEFYRRGQEWKLRAIGQGYDGGLADLITDHGVSVEDAPAAPPAPPAPAAPPPPPPPPAPAAAPAPPAPPAPPTEPAWGQQPAQPAQPAWGQQPAQPQTPPPTQQPPSQPAWGQQPAAAAPPPPPPPPSAPGFETGARPPSAAGGASGGEVSLTKGRPVNLSKGQKVTLVKEGGQALTMVRMGLGWDPIKKGGFFGSREVDIDLDASAVLFAGKQLVDVAFYNNLRTRDGSIQHMGDNLTGQGEGDDEVVMVDLTRVPVHVDNIIFIVTSYQGQTFEQVQNAFCRLVDHQDGELARYALAGGMPFTGLVMAKLTREGSQWKFQAIGDGIQAKVPTEAPKQLERYL